MVAAAQYGRRFPLIPDAAGLTCILFKEMSMAILKMRIRSMI